MTKTFVLSASLLAALFVSASTNAGWAGSTLKLAPVQPNLNLPTTAMKGPPPASSLNNTAKPAVTGTTTKPNTPVAVAKPNNGGGIISHDSGGIISHDSGGITSNAGGSMRH